MGDVETFLEDLRADAALYARVRNAAEELVLEDQDVSDEELGWAAVDLVSTAMDVPDDLDLDRIGTVLREAVGDLS